MLSVNFSIIMMHPFLRRLQRGWGRQCPSQIHYTFVADSPLGPSALTLDNWMLLSQKWLKEESLNLGTGTFWCNYCNNISARLFNYYILSRTLILTHFIYAWIVPFKGVWKVFAYNFWKCVFFFWISTLSYGDHTIRSILLDQAIYFHRDGT